METMTNELTVIPRTIGMMTRMMDVINTEEIEDAVIVSAEVVSIFSCALISGLNP